MTRGTTKRASDSRPTLRRDGLHPMRTTHTRHRPASARASRRVVVATSLAAATLLTSVATAQANSEAARATVRATTSDVLAVLADTSLDTDGRRQRVENIVFASVDFETVSRLVLARNWRRFSEEQRTEFVREFKSHLSRTYGRNIDNYSDQRLEITSDRAEARGDWTVRTRLRRSGAEAILVDYRLRANEGSWKIIDIIVEGVSLIANFRSQFQEILANHDPDHLLKLLHDKNLVSKPVAS